MSILQLKRLLLKCCHSKCYNDPLEQNKKFIIYIYNISLQNERNLIKKRLQLRSQKYHTINFNNISPNILKIVIYYNFFKISCVF